MHDEDLGHLADHLELLATMLAMGALADSLEAARLAHATRHQMFAAETQWVAGIAQASLGQVDVEVVEGSSAEPTLIRRATALLEEVLGRSLQQWQLPMIRTNDASGRGN